MYKKDIGLNRYIYSTKKKNIVTKINRQTVKAEWRLFYSCILFARIVPSQKYVHRTHCLNVFDNITLPIEPDSGTIDKSFFRQHCGSKKNRPQRFSMHAGDGWSITPPVYQAPC